ncbi:hypothetical protein PMZ80_005805 [Knufia obscura]|uniref:Filamentation protein n=1 Tax=Knufia obscura TaxID=1635080 RepID=A0ABR0RNP5_9EURO|nr:hypothetical protein PMZ80_005805 [Knufia obscura]
MSGHEDKGKRYIGLLDAARVKGSWAELPELIRKVTKHASNQTTLIDTATAEHFVASHASSRSQTVTNSDRSPVERLRQTVSIANNTGEEEVFQGQTCLAWAAWTGAASASTDSIPISEVVPLFDRYGQKSTSTWTKICLLRAIFIQGKSNAQRGEDTQALAVYKAAAAWVELNVDVVKSTPQLSYWAEQILAEYGMLETSSVSTDEKLKALRLWSSLVARSPEAASGTYGNPKSHVTRSTTWKAYYHILSESLARPPSMSVGRARSAADLRAVEAAYETALLRDRKFPKATESNAPVEHWIEQVIRNWQLLCGGGWQESDLGEGGRNALTRNVLDVLYRAATKTFHSTLILRRLFEVHKALTEFELAYRCLDTYIELNDRARARAAKAGETNSEADEVMLLTVSEGVEGLCSFGRQQEAQKAFDLATKLEDWLDEIMPEEEASIPNGHAEPDQPVNGTHQQPPSDSVLQTTYRAIGIAKANWAKCSPFTETRNELQAEALTALQKAASLSQPQVPTLYALALLCAETRDIQQALRWTKVGLQRLPQVETSTDNATSNPDRCAFWHLMTLLLSSQQDFDTALQSSAATLESILATDQQSPNSSRNGSVGKHSEKVLAPAAADMECDDLQRIVDLQISYLALVELIDGPEAALNHSGELLSLYSSLFKRFEIGEVKPPVEQTLIPPKNSAGVKSMRGSIFSRRKPTPSIAPSATTASLASAAYSQKDTRPTTQASQAPTIQVTDESGKSPSKKHHHLIHRHHDHNSSAKRVSKSAKPATSQGVADDPRSLQQSPVTSTDGQMMSTSTTNAVDHASPTSAQHDSRGEAKQPLGEVPHNVTSHKEAPPPLGHHDQPPEQDVRLPTVHPYTSSTSPIPRFPKALAQKHALIVLNKMWLTVATLYRRSHMFEDCGEAIEEASKAATRIETIVSTTDPSARALADAGWGGGGKSSDEVWADVYCSRAELLHAIAQRRDEEGTPTTGENLREVIEQYEHCLMYYPDHPSGIVGLSNILLDYYEKRIDLAKKVDDGRSFGVRPGSKQSKEEDLLGSATPSQEHLQDPFSTQAASSEDLKKTPENLNRIAARDRAYGLLSTLTKLGTGWDNSEAWFALARAHELGGEVDRAKKILWWVIELEDTRPIRHWRNLGCGGYVL